MLQASLSSFGQSAVSQVSTRCGTVHRESHASPNAPATGIHLSRACGSSSHPGTRHGETVGQARACPVGSDWGIDSTLRANQGLWTDTYRGPLLGLACSCQAALGGAQAVSCTRSFLFFFFFAYLRLSKTKGERALLSCFGVLWFVYSSCACVCA